MRHVSRQTIEVAYSSDASLASREARLAAASIGFDETPSEEIALVVTELASNLVRHASGGRLIFTSIANGDRSGIQIESVDSGPGIIDVEQAIADGFSTVDSLGYGLGTVSRLMDELDIVSNHQKGGTHITCRRWIRELDPTAGSCPLEFGVATRPHPRMQGINGDTFVIKKWNGTALVGVIDGLGHGQWAQRAAQTARRYIESHFDQSLKDIFLGVARMCRSTRGVVMALAQFDWKHQKLSFASIGNIEVRVFGAPEPLKFIIRRGIIGLNAPGPVVTEHDWHQNSIMVLHSDGIKTHWKGVDIPELERESATVIAHTLLRKFARDEDDATVVVVRSKLS